MLEYNLKLLYRIFGRCATTFFGSGVIIWCVARRNGSQMVAHLLANSRRGRMQTLLPKPASHPKNRGLTATETLTVK